MTVARDWESIIRAVLEKEVAEIAAEEVEKAKARIDARISERMAEIVMATLRHFDVSRYEDRIIISVRDDRGVKR